ncbi:hypothetical protein [Thiomonas sp. FB-6]|uniref:hypothetical protein n=1 Tax=Thiomonas sp. FB-6 TaxID=1158291 RepID=UPI0012DD835E|nr:hypothetical protein [Thiomonas sp. FB-6]
MFKISRLLLVATSCAAAQAFAGEFDTGLERDGYKLTRSPPLVELIRGAVLQSDGSMVFRPGTHSPVANRYHAELCESYGGVDNTDLYEVRFKGVVGDGFSCEFSDPRSARGFRTRQQPPFPPGNPVDPEGRLLRWVPIHPASTSFVPDSEQSSDLGLRKPSEPLTSPLIIEPHAAQGDVAKGVLYYPSSYVDYYNISEEAQYSVESIVYEAGVCKWNEGGLMKPASYRSISYAVACMAGFNQAVKSGITGCHGSACNADEQWVVHQN